MKLDVSDLVERGLVVTKDYPERNLRVLKYHRKVFYNNLWHLDDRLLECRGTVVDYDWNVVVLPFRKVFNYGENGTTVDPNADVEIIRKINGFMFAVTKTKDHGVIYSTTGTLDSDFVEMGKSKLEGFVPSEYNLTYIFEINHEDDPHIIGEECGAVLIGVRFTDSGHLLREHTLDKIADLYGLKRPVRAKMKFSRALVLVKVSEAEGVMVRDSSTDGVLCKLKTPYYLTKKFFMRVGKKKLDRIFDNADNFRKQMDEEYYPLLDFITTYWTKEAWGALSEQQRGEVVEEFLNETERPNPENC